MNSKNAFWIGGRHSVEAAIHAKKRKIFEVVCLQKNKCFDDKNINYTIKNEKFFNKIFYPSHLSHQGIAALVSTLPNVKLDSLSNEITIVMLDGITDPMNIGSIIRSCVAFGIKYMIVRDREFNEKSSSMIKASSGAIEQIQICKVSNLSSSIKYLKTKKFWSVYLDSHAKQNIQDYDWDRKNLIIFGSEGDGVSSLIKANCDTALKIAINNKIESLNVGNAAAIALFTVTNKK